jgi:predicted DCC family thiol-disulfide oxidoreductase YuxK
VTKQRHDPTGLEEPGVAASAARLFYDGSCGLCHLGVRLALRADRTGAVRFAPLEGPTFRRLVPETERGRLPDSLVLRTEDGVLLTRSAAVVALLRRLGPPWPWLASVVAALPTPLADRLYDGVARVRHRLFRHSLEPCPRVRPSWRDRFDP